MLTVSPFAALLPTPERAAQVAAVPYDVVSTAEARQLAEGNPYSFLRVSRPEIELPPATDPHGAPVYDLAASNFARLRAQAPLTFDSQPHYYIYSLMREGRRQSGLVAALAVDDYDEGRIQQHERTRADKEEDRTRHTLALRAHSGPVFLICRSMWAMDSTIQEVMGQHAPLFDLRSADGVLHQVWRVPPVYEQLLRMLFAKTRAIYIADGHHRAKSASRARAELRAANPGHTGQEAYNRFLGVIFPDNQLQILPYHRILKDLHGLTPAELLARAAEVFTVTPAPGPAPAAKGDVHLYLQGRWHCLRVRTIPATATPAQRLDVSLLQDQFLAPVLGIADPRTSQRLDFVGGIRGTAYLQQLVDAGQAAAAFSLFPVTVDELIAISEQGEIMPPKSTWFEPKLRDGLLTHCF
jgi:uncharacterized protein (DUF1015 family)